MRYLSGRPFTVAVGSGKITPQEWARIFGPKVENAALDRSGAKLGRFGKIRPVPGTGPKPWPTTDTVTPVK